MFPLHFFNGAKCSLSIAVTRIIQFAVIKVSLVAKFFLIEAEYGLSKIYLQRRLPCKLKKLSKVGSYCVFPNKGV